MTGKEYNVFEDRLITEKAGTLPAFLRLFQGAH
jgi:hypothetical protein